MINSILKITISDSGENVQFRTAEHILRAQRLAWYCEGFLKHPKLKKLIQSNKKSTKKISRLFEVYEIETAGRLAALKRHSVRNSFNKKASKISKRNLADCTVSVVEGQAHSKSLEIAIPLPDFVSVYIANTYAVSTKTRIDLDSQLRTLETLDNGFNTSNVPDYLVQQLLKEIKNKIGLFDSAVVSKVAIEIRGRSASFSIGKDDNMS